jgi:hypothetical protein
LISAWLDRWLVNDESASATSRCASIIGDKDNGLLAARVLFLIFFLLVGRRVTSISEECLGGTALTPERNAGVLPLI